MSTALLVIDVQSGATSTCPAAEGVLSTINAVIADARRHHAPLIFVQHQGEGLLRGTDGWQLDSRLDYREGDVVVEKEFRDAFCDTLLAQTLTDFNVNRVVIVGVHSDFCVQTTSMSALTWGYDVTLVSDGHAAEPADLAGGRVEAEVVTEFVNARFSTLRHPRQQVEVIPGSQVAFS